MCFLTESQERTPDEVLAGARMRGPTGGRSRHFPQMGAIRFAIIGRRTHLDTSGGLS